MEYQIKLKTYGCTNHPTELIKLICLDFSCNQPFLCNNCLQTHPSNHKNNLLTFDEFLDSIVKVYRNLNSLSRSPTLISLSNGTSLVGSSNVSPKGEDINRSNFQEQNVTIGGGSNMQSPSIINQRASTFPAIGTKLLERNCNLPHEYVTLLQQENIVLEKLKEHLDQQKNEVKLIFEELKSELLELCEEMKQKTLVSLENQYWNLRSNYKVFKKKLFSCYGYPNSLPNGGSTNSDYVNRTSVYGSPFDIYFMNQGDKTINFDKKFNIVTYINDTITYEDYALKLNKLRDDILESAICSSTSLDNFMNNIHHAIKDFANNITLQNTNFPIPKFLEFNNDPNRLLTNVILATTKAIQNETEIINQIEELSALKAALSSSKIIKKYEDISLLKSWVISPFSKNFKNNNLFAYPPTTLSPTLTKSQVLFKLIYQGSRDGFTASKFHELCDNYWPTLTLIQSDYNKIFGGYTDQSWVSINHYKKSMSSFIFSLTEKKKCDLIDEKSTNMAIYTDKNHLTSFGEGMEIEIVDNCNIMSCRSKLGLTYEDGSMGKIDWFTGGKTFKVKEIEVFYVMFI